MASHSRRSASSGVYAGIGFPSRAEMTCFLPGCKIMTASYAVRKRSANSTGGIAMDSLRVVAQWNLLRLHYAPQKRTSPLLYSALRLRDKKTYHDVDTHAHGYYPWCRVGRTHIALLGNALP